MVKKESASSNTCFRVILMILPGFRSRSVLACFQKVVHIANMAGFQPLLKHPFSEVTCG